MWGFHFGWQKSKRRQFILMIICKISQWVLQTWPVKIYILRQIRNANIRRGKVRFFSLTNLFGWCQIKFVQIYYATSLVSNVLLHNKWTCSWLGKFRKEQKDRCLSLKNLDNPGMSRFLQLHTYVKTTPVTLSGGHFSTLNTFQVGCFLCASFLSDTGKRRIKQFTPLPLLPTDVTHSIWYCSLL